MDRELPRQGIGNLSWKADFGPEWTAFLDAWTARGLRYPPTPRQREVLWDAVDNRPNDAARWVREAPRDGTVGEIVGYVLKKWHEFRTTVPA